MEIVVSLYKSCEINESCAEWSKVFILFFASIFPSSVSGAKLSFFDKLAFLSLMGNLTLVLFFSRLDLDLGRVHYSRFIFMWHLGLVQSDYSSFFPSLFECTVVGCNSLLELLFFSDTLIVDACGVWESLIFCGVRHIWWWRRCETGEDGLQLEGMIVEKGRLLARGI